MPFHDIRIAVRHLLKSPGFTATAVLMLALGIGATTAIFSIVEGVLLRPLPFPHPERLVQLADILQGADVGGNGEAGVTAPDIQAYTRDTHSFESLGGYRQTSYELSGIGEPAQVNAARLSGGVFPALQVEPLTRPVSLPSGKMSKTNKSRWSVTRSGKTACTAIRACWEARFLLDRKPYVVIGVMPRNFEFPLVPGHLNSSELWVPMSFDSGAGTERERSGQLELQHGGTAQTGNHAGAGGKRRRARGPGDHAQLSALHGEFAYPRGGALAARGNGRAGSSTGAHSVSGHRCGAADRLRQSCGVAAGARHSASPEVAVRLALGARVGMLLRQAILESLVLSVSGGLLGLVLAAIALRVGVSWLPETLPRINEIGLDWQGGVVRDCPRRGHRPGLRTGSGFCRPADERE